MERRVELTKLRRQILEELLFRVGAKEAGKQMGCHPNTISHWVGQPNRKTETINIEVMRAAIQYLRTARTDNRFYSPLQLRKTGPRSKRALSVKDGKKLCRGHLHPEPVWLPVSQFYQHKSKNSLGHYFSQCKECHKTRNSALRGEAPMERIHVNNVRWIFEMLRRDYRFVSDMARDTGIHESTIASILKRSSKRPRYITKDTAAKALTVLYQNKEKQKVAREAQKKMEVAA